MMMPHIISEYLGNPTPVRAPRGDMKCSSNKQTAQPVTSSHFIPDSILIFSFSSLFSATMSTIFTADISHYCFSRRQCTFFKPVYFLAQRMRNFGQFGLFTHFWCTFYRFKYYVLVPKLINISYDNFIIHKRVTLINDVNKVAKAEFALRFYIERVESIENINRCHSPLTQIILPPTPL